MMRADMTDTRVVLIDSDPITVMRAVEKLGLTDTVLDVVESLGIGDRVALAPTRLATDGTCAYRYGMTWRVDLDRPGCVKVVWDVRVEAGGDTGTLLSTTACFTSTDADSRDRLNAAWPIVGPMVAALSKRALAAVKLAAEEAVGRSASRLALAA